MTGETSRRGPIATSVLTACALVLTGGPRAAAEQPEGVAPGDRVRVAAPQLWREPVVGRLLDVGPETLSLELPGGNGPEAIPRSAVTRLEVSRGRKSQAGRGALVGLAIGGAATMLLTFGDYSSDVHGDPNLLAIGAALAGGGAAVGGAIGWAIKTDQWEDVTQRPVQVGVSPIPGGGLGFAVRLTWATHPAGGH